MCMDLLWGRDQSLIEIHSVKEVGCVDAPSYLIHSNERQFFIPYKKKRRMKLKKYTVKEFRSVLDSGEINIDDKVTCLVGKNESGKTALLQALYRVHPINAADATFDLDYDYPRQEIGDYKDAIENDKREETVVVSCEYEIEDDDEKLVSDVFGGSVIEGENIRSECVLRRSTKSIFDMPVDEGAARRHLAENSNFSAPLQKQLKSVGDWDAFSAALEKTTEVTIEGAMLGVLVAEVIEKGLAHYIFSEMIWPSVPKFLYFDEYYQMEGRANLNALIQREDTDTLKKSDHPLLGLIHLARLDPRKLIKIESTEELTVGLESGGNYLTKRIMKHWSQNQHIRMSFDIRDGKLKDPEGMRDGVNILGRVYDTVHDVHTPLGSRSHGFIWFFSFFAWYEDIKRKKQNVILLLDEPGLSLHGRAQSDLLDYFESDLIEHQIIYTTHSPFMVDPQKFERVRIVQDLSIDKKEKLPRNQDGTKVFTDVLSATDDSLFPLQGALGYEIQQTLFIAPNSLIVEGPSDMLFLRAMSVQLQRDGRAGLSGRWVITPVGGSGKVSAFVSLLSSQKGMNVAVLLDIQLKDRQHIANLYKKKLLKKKQVLTYADFLNQNEEDKEADIEDIFLREFYVDLVNKEFSKELKAPIEVDALNKNEPRTLRAIKDYLEENPFQSGAFSHYRPAQYFSENVGSLWSEMSDEVKDRFQEIFTKLNKLL